MRLLGVVARFTPLSMDLPREILYRSRRIWKLGAGMRIGFQAGAINERGMSVALHDYVVGTQALPGHEALVFYDEAKSAPAVVEKFRRSLTLVPVPAGRDGRARVACCRPEAVMNRFDAVFLSGAYPTGDLELPLPFKAKRILQEKAMRAKFRLWKSL
ncbi:hypothetical protein [uncultured Roseibium sp.]|uniref:hypothetical protein n=1 Tax=uncultured Roseibium sp. TaxID=1936171 RepID=UPI002627E114|nr:hypothetical protein [uncultured Roseibium sp.]